MRKAIILCSAGAAVVFIAVRARWRRRSDAAAAGEARAVRIWIDGVFDLMHFGHANAFRQARSCGTWLVVGVNDDESVTRCKGAPILTEEERAVAVEGCRWVDQVVRRVPYVMDEAYVRQILDEYEIDYIVHGDDPCFVDGINVFEVAIRLGRFRTFPRTEGVSTTEIVRRMLDSSGLQPRCAGSHLLTVNALASSWASARGAGEKPRRVVYIDGAFDLLHAGHMAALCAARALGDFLLVGVHGDETVRDTCGPAHPIMQLGERLVSVLGCRHVDDVLIDPPWHISREMIASLEIAVVVRARLDDELAEREATVAGRYETARALQIYAELPVDAFSYLSTAHLVDRVVAQSAQLSNRVAGKAAAERRYYDERYGISR